MLKACTLQLLFTLTATGIAQADDAKRLLLGTASNFMPVLDALDAKELATVSSNSTGQLVLQALKGAPFDAVIVASTGAKDQLMSAHPNASAYKLASGRLALACENDQLLREPNQASIAIANPSTAPFGRAAAQWLADNDIHAKRLVRSRSASQAFGYLSGGQVDCAITSVSWVIERWPAHHWRKLSVSSDELDQWLVSLRPHSRLEPLLENIYSTDLTLLGYDDAHD